MTNHHEIIIASLVDNIAKKIDKIESLKHEYTVTVEHLNQRIDHLQNRLHTAVSANNAISTEQAFESLDLILTPGLEASEPITVVKAIRQLTNCSLKEAKNFFDNHRDVLRTLHNPHPNSK